MALVCKLWRIVRTEVTYDQVAIIPWPPQDRLPAAAPITHGGARLGGAGRCAARHGQARQGLARQGEVPMDEASVGEVIERQAEKAEDDMDLANIDGPVDVLLNPTKAVVRLTVVAPVRVARLLAGELWDDLFD
jgi:hypothetical protein